MSNVGNSLQSVGCHDQNGQFCQVRFVENEQINFI